MTATTTTLSPIARRPRRSATQARRDWLANVCLPINQAVINGKSTAQLTDYMRALVRIREEGPLLGRTERWNVALTWFDAHLVQGADLAWVLLQGSVYLNYAAE